MKRDRQERSERGHTYVQTYGHASMHVCMQAGKHTYIYTYNHMGRQRVIQANIRSYRQVGRQCGWQSYRKTGKRTCRQEDRAVIHTVSHTSRQTNGHTYRQASR